MGSGMTTPTDGEATVAAIYARVSSERQRQEQTIASQTAALRELAEQRGLLVSDELVFEDDGFSGGARRRAGLGGGGGGGRRILGREPAAPGARAAARPRCRGLL